MTVRVYIDGFNFYYGSVKNSPHKWVNFGALCNRILPGKEIERIKYFTAIVKGDPNAAARQSVYLRALRIHVPQIQIVEGHFLEAVKWGKSVATGKVEKFLAREEKGSDVNLAVHLVYDAWRGKFDSALVISNDSDLSEAMRLVIERRKLPVGVCNPQLRRGTRNSFMLSRVASYRVSYGRSLLANCQLPNPVIDPVSGTSIHKPNEW